MPVLSNSHALAARGDGLEANTTTRESHTAHGPADNPNQDTSSTTSIQDRRRWPVVAALLAVAVVIAAWLATRTGLGSDPDSTAAPAQPAAVRTVSAEQRDLLEYTEIEGRMVYDDVVTATAPVEGVITAVSDEPTLERGDLAYELNDTPVDVFYGPIPLYRPLAAGSVGDDVVVLEQNLAALGHHAEVDDEGAVVDTGFVVDGVFDDATEAAVIRWQRDTGRPETGTVEPSDSLVLDGPADVIDRTAELGDRVAPGAPLMELSASAVIDTTHVEHGGEIELLVEPGTEILTGTIVYTADELPVTAVVTDAAIDRRLAENVDAGDDIRGLEQMLTALGYDAGGELVVDDRFDQFTEEAVVAWQEDLHEAFELVEVDGEVVPDDIIVLAPGSVVGAPAPLGDEPLASGSVLWTSETPVTRRVVETAIAASDQERLAEGTSVDVEFPDGEIVTGVVTDRAASSTVDPTDPEGEPTLAATIRLSSVPESADGLNELDVQVLLVDQLAEDTTVVPVSALVATGDGNYAVEALTTTGGTRRVPVEPGVFDDGWVEVSGIEPGTQVVVP